MKLDKLQIKNFRNIDDLSLIAHGNLNLFLGENGSGKSSILEALHYLGYARSFRTHKHKNVISHEKAGFTVFCSTVVENEKQQKFGISRLMDDSCIVNINGQKSKRATDLASHLPIQIFTPQSSDLLLGAPKLRRRYLDWVLFHVEQSFNLDFQVFNKSLKHLNSLYKKHQPDQNLSYWNDLLCERGETISANRECLLNDHLMQLINANLKDFLPEFSFEISYYRGWEKGSTLAESVLKNRLRDQKYGFLSVGPHKADLRIKTQGANAHEILSRGQLRMLVAGMQLAQTQYLHQQTSKSSIFLLDDVGAELDEEKRKVFISRLNTTDTQLFVTAIDIKQLDFLKNYNDKKVFHVEHGQVKEEI
ncbi:DNA replication/repair protein RecF [uncultured Paraglaciecola sp.]|uniref:DNA replication/repair protein RecF n=1 Tax=uncultured Paraglaciecola sp. TaxID=1765024 RepID=UPI0030D95B13|tara:strand:- start:59965 stop:61053 length:1089 start_codon:yes stop_codon:yes gene_type:complete